MSHKNRKNTLLSVPAWKGDENEAVVYHQLQGRLERIMQYTDGDEFIGETTERKMNDFESWDDSDWGWKDEETDEATEKEQDSLSWLQECQISLSPAGELMALGNDDRLVLLAQKYNAGEDEVEIKYSLIYEGSVKHEENEKITCILCVPLASQKRSTQGGPDWTCVFVGFSSGYVRMFTENGTLLLSQLFSEEPVVSIKCRTYEPPRHATDAEKGEELNILYKKSLVSVDGFSLFQSLRACRNQVARAAASGADFMQPPPLAYKKWALHEHELVTDQAACGTSTPNPFDQMVTASMIGGYSAAIRPTPPASHLYLSTGKTPYTGFYYIVEGSTQPMLSDVAHAVASKLKSALFNQISAASGWFGLGGKQQPEASKERKRPKIEAATSVTARYGMHDKRRQGESVVLAPDNRMAVTTDSFGRVILFDVVRGIGVRIWKGYRDAQVAWVEVKEDQSIDQQAGPKYPRRAMFLVIYAPRRGILEVWTSQQGPRVAAFSVSKWCTLLSPSFGLMGLNNATYKDMKVNMHHLYLVDPEGSVKTIDIPFHLALSDKNSKRARDQHLLKKLKISLKDNTAENSGLRTEVINLLMDMKVSSIRQQGLERVLLTRYLSVEFLESVIKAVVAQLHKQAEESEKESAAGEMESEKLDYESKVLLHFCQAEGHLIKTYSALHALSAEVQEKNGQSDIENLEEKLTKVLSLHPSEISQIKTELENYDKALGEKSRVTFESDLSMSVVEFLSCFECQMHKEGSGTGMTVKIHAALSENRRMKLANFLYKAVLESGTSSDYNLRLKESHILPEDLMELLLQLWLSVDNRSMSTVGHLYSLIKSIAVLKDSGEVTGEHREVSPWWQRLRDRLIQSTHISSALLAALVARSVAMEIGKAVMTQDLVTPTMDDCTKYRLSEWESVTLDKTQWTVLVKQLEDLLVLQGLLKLKAVDAGIVSQTLWETEAVEVTVKKVMDGGRGMLPEFIAKWITGHGIAPRALSVHHSDTDVGQSAADNASEGATESSPEPPVENPIVRQLQAIQNRLPYSLDADILMANCAWEYMVIWNKDPEVIMPLELALAYMKCIQNAALQYGVSVMMWHMFLVKKFSAAALLIEKVGKAPKDRLCRKEIGLSELSLEKFMRHLVDLLDTIIQSSEESSDIPVLNIEDLWQSIQGPTSLVELALEQKTCNVPLVAHHHSLCVIMSAVLTFSMRSVKPMSLYDTKGRNAFFRPLQSNATLPGPSLDESLIKARKQVMSRILTQAVQTLGEPNFSDPPASPSHKLPSQGCQYSHWAALTLRVGKQLMLDVDDLSRHMCCELYSSAWEKLAEEVLLTVNNHEDVGSQLLVISGKRLHRFVFETESTDSVEAMSKCSTSASMWLKTLESSDLRVPDPPLSDTATLLGHAVNALPEGHEEYNLALELVELVQAFL